MLFVMAGEEIKKPRARASRDGRSLEPILPRAREPEAPTQPQPDQINDDARTLWRSTRIDGDTFKLLDGDGNTVATLPFTDENLRHYMGGPEQNAAAVDAQELSVINELRRAQGEPEVASHEQLEEEQKAERAARKRAGPNRKYSEKDSERVKHNMRTRLPEISATDDEKNAIAALIEGVHDTESARRVKERLDALTPEVAPRPRRNKEAPAPDAEQAPAAAPAETPTDASAAEAPAEEVAEQPQPEAVEPEIKDPFENTNIDELLGRLSARERNERTRSMRQNMNQPERTIGARPSHQEMHDRLTGASDPAPEPAQNTHEQPEQPASSDAHDEAAAPPIQPPSEALRQSSGNSHEGRNRRESKKKYEYKVDARNYLGLNIMAVQSIIHDPVHAQYFGELLHTIAPEMSDEEKRDNPGKLVATEVLARYNAGSGTPEDMSFMKYAAHEYTKWHTAWEKLSTDVTETDVDVFMRRNEMLDNIAAHVGGTRGKEVLLNSLRHTAMRDQKAFESFEHAVHHMHSVRGSYLGRKAEGKIQSLAERVGIARDDFETVFDFSTPEAERTTHQHLVELFHRKAGKGRRMMDAISPRWLPLVGSSEIAADNAVRDAKAALSGRFGRTGKKLGQLGETLTHASEDLSRVIGTPEMIDLITKETITNERMRPGAEAGPVSFAEVQQKSAEIKPPALEQLLSEKITSDPNWARGTPAYRQTEIQKMKQAGEKALNAGTGFWSMLLRIAFGIKFDKAAKNAERAAGAVH